MRGIVILEFIDRGRFQEQEKSRYRRISSLQLRQIYHTDLMPPGDGFKVILQCKFECIPFFHYATSSLSPRFS